MKFNNIPIVDLRWEFQIMYEFVHSAEGEDAFDGPVEPIPFPIFTWYGFSNDFATILIQRSFLGIESYLPYALSIASAKRGVATTELLDKFRNPFSFGARSLAQNLYDRAPKAVNQDLSLLYMDKKLYQETLELYKNIRNPVFHGKQLSEAKTESIRAFFKQVSMLYEWIDTWSEPIYGIEKMITLLNRNT